MKSVSLVSWCSWSYVWAMLLPYRSSCLAFFYVKRIVFFQHCLVFSRVYTWVVFIRVVFKVRVVTRVMPESCMLAASNITLRCLCYDYHISMCICSTSQQQAKLTLIMVMTVLTTFAVGWSFSMCCKIGAKLMQS